MRTVDAHLVENWLQMRGIYHGVIAYDTVISVLHDAPTVEPQQWTPVTERLPEVRQRVLCQCRAGIQEVLRLTDDGNWECIYPHTIYMKSFVIAWMPLPEPYQERGEDE